MNIQECEWDQHPGVMTMKTKRKNDRTLDSERNRGRPVMAASTHSGDAEGVQADQQHRSAGREREEFSRPSCEFNTRTWKLLQVNGATHHQGNLSRGSLQ